MTYVAGFVQAVPAANKEAYREHAAGAAALFREFGASRVVEAWGDDVPDGESTDFRRAVKAAPDEAIVFSWHEYPSKEAAGAAYEKMMSDPRMEGVMASMPFDGKRMIHGGFAPFVSRAEGGSMGYVDGSLVAVPSENRDAFRRLMENFTTVLIENGATRVVDAWGDDVPDGEITDYRGAVKAEAGEEVVFSWVEWPSREARDAGWQKVIADPRMYEDTDTGTYDNGRRVSGGFRPLLDL